MIGFPLQLPIEATAARQIGLGLACVKKRADGSHYVQRELRIELNTPEEVTAVREWLAKMPRVASIASETGAT